MQEFYNLFQVNESLLEQATPSIPTREKQRKIAQPSQQGMQDILETLNSWTGSSFDNLGDFFKQYSTTSLKYAYENLDPATCQRIAIGNAYISSAVNSISKSISSSKIIPIPNDKNNPNNFEIFYLSWLMSNPNPRQTDVTFKKLICNDLLQTGAVYIEVAYFNDNSGLPAALYRVPPYKIKTDKVAGRIFYTRTDTGYTFKQDELITIFNPNPFSDYKGLSPIVSLFNEIMLNESITEHNIKYYINDVLKGIISLSDKLGYDTAEKETKRISDTIAEMKRKGTEGHLVMLGATFQALSSTNKDMLTDKLKEEIISAISAVYHVPPHKVMRVDSGNIGSGTGESQDESMNETLKDWGDLILSYFNTKLLELAGIKNTTLGFLNLTRSDERKQAEVNAIYLDKGVIGIDEIRTDLGRDALDLDSTREPTLPADRIPASKIGDQTFVSGYGEGGGGSANTKQMVQSILKMNKKFVETFEDY